MRRSSPASTGLVGLSGCVLVEKGLCPFDLPLPLLWPTPASSLPHTTCQSPAPQTLCARHSRIVRQAGLGQQPVISRELGSALAVGAARRWLAWLLHGLASDARWARSPGRQTLIDKRPVESGLAGRCCSGYKERAKPVRAGSWSAQSLVHALSAKVPPELPNDCMKRTPWWQSGSSITNGGASANGAKGAKMSLCGIARGCKQPWALELVISDPRSSSFESGCREFNIPAQKSTTSCPGASTTPA
jgi:hypothetical protein